MPDHLADFLSLHAVKRSGSPPIFALTPSSLAITVYRQQIRALNLAYAIGQSPIATNPEGKHVAVIGGGFAGVTVAAGLLKLGFNVHLFEQRPELCHLQSGCETRWLHPRIYEWPNAHSDLDDARLPLLNWSAGSAGDVARIVRRQFETLVENSANRFHLYLRANARLSGSDVQWDNADSTNSNDATGWRGRGGQTRFDLVVLAVGFGVEEGVLNNDATSYWRNDRYSQAQPGIRSERRELILVSGTGDGAFIDLIRVCLQGFKHNRLIQDLFIECPVLIEHLQEMRERHLEELGTDDNASLFGALEDLRKVSFAIPLGQQVKLVETRINKALRRDTRAILNGEYPSFHETLSIKDKSFLNVCIAYCLYQARAFTYIGGRSTKIDKHEVDIAGYGRLRVDDALFRHGSRREDVMRRAGLAQGEIEKLFRKRTHDPKLLLRLWAPGWWSHSIVGGTQDKWWLERVPDVEQVVAAVTLGPLEQRIRALPSMNDCLFRVTLHQTMHYPSSMGILHCYQQLSPYFGTASGDRLKGKAGRVFLTRPEDEKAGLVGMTIETGCAIFAQLPQVDDPDQMGRWINLWQRLIPFENDENGVSRFRQMDPTKVTTVVTVPIIAKLKGGGLGVRYVLYLDIEHGLSGVLPNRDEIMKQLWHEAFGISKSITMLREIDANGQRFIAPPNGLCADHLVEIPSREAWAGLPLGEFQEFDDEFGNFLNFQFPPTDVELLTSPDVLELQSAV